MEDDQPYALHSIHPETYNGTMRSTNPINTSLTRLTNPDSTPARTLLDTTKTLALCGTHNESSISQVPAQHLKRVLTHLPAFPTS